MVGLILGLKKNLLCGGGVKMRIGFRKFVGVCPITPDTESIMWGVDDHYFLLKGLVEKGHDVFILSDVSKQDIFVTGQMGLVNKPEYEWMTKLKYYPYLESVADLDLDMMIIESGPNNVSVDGRSLVLYEYEPKQYRWERMKTLFAKFAGVYGYKTCSGHDVIDLVEARKYIRVPVISEDGTVRMSRVKKLIRHTYTGGMVKISYGGEYLCLTQNHSLVTLTGNSFKFVEPGNNVLGVYLKKYDSNIKVREWEIESVPITVVKRYNVVNQYVYDIEVEDSSSPMFLVNRLFVHNTFTDGNGQPSMLHTVKLLDSFEDGVVCWYLTDLVNPFPFYEMTSKEYRMSLHSMCDANKLFGKNKRHYILHHSLNEKVMWDYFTDVLKRCSWGLFPVKPVYVPIPYDGKLGNGLDKRYDITYIGHNYGSREGYFSKYYLPWGKQVNVWGDGWEEYSEVINWRGRTRNYMETVDILSSSKMTIFLTSSLGNRISYLTTRIFEALSNDCVVVFPPELSVSSIMPEYQYDDDFVKWILSADKDVYEKILRYEQNALKKYCDTGEFIKILEGLR